MLRDFLKYASLFVIVQSAFWGLSWRWESLLEKFSILYYPTILLVEYFGDFHGEANIIYPFWIGIPLGILAYSSTAAAAIAMARKVIH